MLMSTGDGSGNIKADWHEVEKIMTSWGYSFTAGAMCKSSRLDALVPDFPPCPPFLTCAVVELFTRAIDEGDPATGQGFRMGSRPRTNMTEHPTILSIRTNTTAHSPTVEQEDSEGVQGAPPEQRQRWRQQPLHSFQGQRRLHAQDSRI